MKNNTSYQNFLNVSSVTEKDTLENTSKKANFPSKASKDMPSQLIAPPSHVWNKIEAILNQQDKRRKSADDIIAASFGINTPGSNLKKLFIAATACLSFVAGLIWIIL